jgi:tetratricopeptide (TPR) repeat protein
MTPPAGPPVPGSTDWPTEASPAAGGFFRRLLGWRSRAPDAQPPIPGSIGRYRVVRKLGEGGMGVVFEVEDDVLGRRLAVKRLKSGDESSRRRFLREARAAARLSHPNICHLYDASEDSQGMFLAMELLAGEPLSRRIERGPLPPAEVVPLGAGMLAALTALHAAGIVHRDLKPSNVYLTPHGPRLLDFGLARPLPGELLEALGLETRDRTHPEIMVGTPGYMAPEQVLGKEVDARTDLFAAGAVLYESVTGARAFSGTTLVEVLTATLHDDPPPLRGDAAPFEGVVRRALCKTPADRFTTAEEMAEALRAAASPPVGARAASSADGREMRDVFAGRASEIARLQAHLARALGGSGSVVFVTGERGSGKSALVGEFLQQARLCAQPVTVASGRCMERQGPGETFLPFLDAFGRLLSTRARDVAVDLVRTWAPTLGIQMPAALVPDPDGSLQRSTAGATRERLVREAGDFFEAAARLYPVVLLLEDLQWADPASVDLLCHLGRRIPKQRMLLLASYRASDAEGLNPVLKRGALELRATGVADELALGPLDPAEVRQWLDARFSPNGFPPGLADALHGRTDGLPLFVRALLEVLAARGEIRRDGNEWGLARPLQDVDLEPSRDLKDLVRAQLESLSAADRDILGAAAVIGREYSSPVAAALAGSDPIEAEERLLRLSRVHRVIEGLGDEELPDGTLGTRYRFAHGLFRRVLYEDLVAPRRALLHRRCAELLTRHWGEADPMLAARVAEHYELGRDAANAARFRSRAGDNALHRFAASQAEEQYTCALRLVEKLPQAERAALEIGLLRRRATARSAQTRFEDALRDYEAMLERARSAGSLAAECDALSGLSGTTFVLRSPAMASRVREGLAAAEREGSPHRLSEARVRAGLLLVVEGRLAEAARALDDVIASARASAATSALKTGLWYRGFVHYWQSEYQMAEVLGTEGFLVAEGAGDAFEALAARTFAALSRANLGRLSEAIGDFEQALALAERNRDAFWGPRLVTNLGWVRRELQAPDRAREFDMRALEMARENPHPWNPEAEALINLCVDDVRTGHQERAAELLARLEADARQSAWMRWMRELRLEAAAAEHWVARGDLDVAASRAARLLEIARPLGARTYCCAARRVRLQAALHTGTGIDKAASRLATALAEFETSPAPLEAWKSGRLLGLAWERLGKAPQARRAFDIAARAIRTIAAGTLDEGLRSGFLDSPPVHEVLERSPAVHEGR